MKKQPDLWPVAIYCLQLPDKVSSALKKGSLSFTENKSMTRAKNFYEKAKQAGEQVVVLLGNSSHCASGIRAWGVIDELTIDGSKSKVDLVDVQEIPGPPRPPSSLILESSGAAMSALDQRSYRIVRLPDFCNRRPELSPYSTDDLPSETVREVLAKMRLVQGTFRQDLLHAWDGRCSVSGCGVEEVLEAAHIKPWSECTDAERQSCKNGLLLTANLHVLFDNRMISFDMDGRIMISERLPEAEWRRLGVDPSMRLREPNKAGAEFLAHHRTQFKKKQ